MYSVPDQHGRRIIVTGANSGTGKEATRRLAAAGATVVMAVRTLSKGEAARDEILREVPNAELELERLDLADLTSVSDFVSRVTSGGRPVDTLVNNAGVMAPPRREVTADGFELQFGSNFLGPFALTNQLLPTILKSRTPRIVTMSSSAANGGRINWEDPNWEHGYNALRAYGQSKLADAVMGIHLADLSKANGWGLVSNLAHPGYTRTNLLLAGPNMGSSKTERPFMYRFFPSMDVTQGTEPLLHAAAEPASGSVHYFGPRWFLVGDTHHARLPRRATKVDAARLWALAEKLTGTSTSTP
ncbi:SDR family oxidoreductase [Pseudonocardia kujensis]|uniref:SDR family oxidoreductase n=1 Tax=Pseudonocardia kujensis TaxID=1128675 RepID=UPI001E5D8663|nr:SDR family oxidoreductase [Pseudonocardia kujensis]MCE0763508.1 SDR family oxidoreductase [Pseudonocardia kujensis]